LWNTNYSKRSECDKLEIEPDVENRGSQLVRNRNGGLQQQKLKEENDWQGQLKEMLQNH
jgi:hypothetical protein